MPPLPPQWQRGHCDSVAGTAAGAVHRAYILFCLEISRRSFAALYTPAGKPFGKQENFPLPLCSSEGTTSIHKDEFAAFCRKFCTVSTKQPPSLHRAIRAYTVRWAAVMDTPGMAFKPALPIGKLILEKRPRLCAEYHKIQRLLCSYGGLPDKNLRDTKTGCLPHVPADTLLLFNCLSWFGRIHPNGN